MTDEVAPARRLWQLIEPIHAVAYFGPGYTDALKGLGLRGFWMCYFAGRAAPMGAVSAGTVSAAFYNFDPRMVHRAIPDAWERTTPAAVIETRAAAAAAMLRALVPGVEEKAGQIVPLLSSAVRSARSEGRPIFAGNQDLPLPDDPVAALWQSVTSLREHRGDGHVAMLVGYEVSGLEAHHLSVAAGMADDARLREVRGWDEDVWEAARARVADKGWVDSEGRLTDAGAQLRSAVERRTDAIAMQPYADGLTEPGLELLPSLLRPLANAVVDSGLLPFPNPIGLPRPE